MAPRRLLFIASLGNPPPYRTTRHSAGHLLLDRLLPLLQGQSQKLTPFYKTWHSTSYMNESGPKLVKQFQKWLETQEKLLSGPMGMRMGVGMGVGGLSQSTSTSTIGTGGSRIGLPATLVLLHDELEAPLGKIRIKRGGPESASLRGHRGLISTFQSLRGKGLYTADSGRPGQQSKSRSGREISVLRVGIGIGRPDSREKDAVAGYVLSEMGAAELGAVERAAGPVMAVLEEEFEWEGPASGSEGVKKV